MTKRSVLTAVVVVLTLTVGFAGGWLAHRPESSPGTPRLSPTAPVSGIIGLPGPLVKVPDVVGDPLTHAMATLHRLGLRGVMVSGLVVTPQGNRVLGQRPAPGTIVSELTKVMLFVS